MVTRSIFWLQADIEKLQDELFKSNQQNEILEKKLLEKETSLSQTGGKNIQKVHQGSYNCYNFHTTFL